MHVQIPEAVTGSLLKKGSEKGQEKMFCPYCGNEIIQAAGCCAECGAAVQVSYLHQNLQSAAMQPNPVNYSMQGNMPNAPSQPAAAFGVQNDRYFLTKTMTRGAQIAMEITDSWSNWCDIEHSLFTGASTDKRFYIRDRKDIQKFCAKEDKRMKSGTYYICIVSPDGAIGMTGTYVEDENDPGSIDWIYITKERELEELPDHIQGLNIIYMD